MAQAKWLVKIDWNDDGDFSDSDEDVTADVFGLTLEQFRDLSNEHIEAARLEMELRNDDHKYSPPNGNSPLSGNLKPGRKVWARAAYPFDSFTDASGVQLPNHALDYDAAFAWTKNRRDFDIVSAGTGAETDSVQGNGRCIVTVDFGDPDASFGCDFTRGTDVTDHGGLSFRYVDNANYMFVRITGTAIEVKKMDGGIVSPVGSGSFTWAVSTTKFLQVVLHGSSIRIFIDAQEVVDASTSFNIGATRHGLYCDDEADHVWDNFGGWVSLFYGAIDSIHPRPSKDRQYCYVRALDEMERLTSVTLHSQAQAEIPQTTDEILGDILSYSAVDDDRRQLDSGIQVIPELWSPPMWGVQATDEIHKLQDEEDGFIYVDGHGYWRMEGRSHRTSAPHTSSKATIKEVNDGTNAYFSDLVWDDGVSNVENVVYMRMRDATNQGLKTTWTLSETTSFSANETKEFLAETQDYDIVVGQQVPVENTDYDANTAQDGSGTDISSELTVTHPKVLEFSGKGTIIRVKFGATAGYLTLLQLRSLNALLFDDPLLVFAEDSTSKSTFGQRTKRIDARWTRETSVGQATVDSRLARNKDPKTVVNVTIPNGSKANLWLILQRGLSDRVTVSYSDMGISGDFFIEGQRLDVSEGWTLVRRELLLQAV
ncbi:MAG: hypothetical protein IIC83_03500 [Chloroflexi bacterium]|nr:hypothetical protein [Chloroflexota bacterium]